MRIKLCWEKEDSYIRREMLKNGGLDLADINLKPLATKVKREMQRCTEFSSKNKGNRPGHQDTFLKFILCQKIDSGVKNTLSNNVLLKLLKCLS